MKLLLDGQQRVTSLYGVMRGRPPKFFDGNESRFTGLQFHLEEEVFEFYQPVKTDDHNLWKIENYSDFLAARRKILAREANHRFAQLLHGDTEWLDTSAKVTATGPVAAGTVANAEVPLGSISTEKEEEKLETINDWIEGEGLPRGQISFDLSDETTGIQLAILDLAWPDGPQPELSVPVAVLLNEPAEVLSVASAAGYRCFTEAEVFRAYVNAEILGSDAAAT